MPSKQEFFDKTVCHLRTQGVMALKTEEALCLLRTPEGLSCAIGCHIPENLSIPDGVNTEGWSSPKVQNLLAGRMPLPLDPIFMGDIQDLHDNRHNWDETGFVGETAAEKFATKHGLTYTPPKGPEPEPVFLEEVWDYSRSQDVEELKKRVATLEQLVEPAKTFLDDKPLFTHLGLLEYAINQKEPYPTIKHCYENVSREIGLYIKKANKQ